MSYEKKELIDLQTVIDKELVDHLQDGIAANDSAISRVKTQINEIENSIPDEFKEIVSGNDIVLRYMQRGTADDFYVRCPDFREDEDFVWWVCYTGRKHNIQDQFTLPKSEPNSAMYVASPKFLKWKPSSDDTAPININGTYIAGNHGATVVEQVTASSSDKTTADIGSVWSSNGHTYMLVRVSGTNLWFIQTDAEKITSGTTLTCANKPTGTMTHVSGATNTADITVSSGVSNTQLTPAINHNTSSVYVDGVKVDAYGTYTGKRVALVNEYDVVYVPAMLEYLASNIGNNNNESFASNEITENFCSLKLIQEIHSNGSMCVYQTMKFNKDVTLSTNFIAQMGPFNLEGEKTYTYIPDTTNAKNVTLHPGSTVDTKKESWESAEKAPYRFYTFADEGCQKGYAIIYDGSWGWGEQSKRIACNANSAGSFASTKKLYPCLASGINLKAGTYYDGCAVRIPIEKYHDDLTSVVWYWRGKDIILCIDNHKKVNTEIVLPEYMANKKVEILDKTESVITEPAYIYEDHKMSYATNSEYGYAVFRLYN